MSPSLAPGGGDARRGQARGGDIDAMFARAAPRPCRRPPPRDRADARAGRGLAGRARGGRAGGRLLRSIPRGGGIEAPIGCSRSGRSTPRTRSGGPIAGPRDARRPGVAPRRLRRPAPHSPAARPPFRGGRDLGEGAAARADPARTTPSAASPGRSTTWRTRSPRLLAAQQEFLHMVSHELRTRPAADFNVDALGAPGEAAGRPRSIASCAIEHSTSPRRAHHLHAAADPRPRAPRAVGDRAAPGELLRDPLGHEGRSHPRLRGAPDGAPLLVSVEARLVRRAVSQPGRERLPPRPPRRGHAGAAR